MTRRRAGRDSTQARQPDLFAAAAPPSPAPPQSPRPATPDLQSLPAAPRELWDRLAYSRFRARFHLGAKERDYLATRGLPEVMAHAADFIATRLAPAHPDRDGRQTPWRGHPVFIAQHATGTCCRGCVAKWHAMPAGQPLDTQQQAYILSVIQEWISRDAATPTPRSAPRPDPR
ncbi:DUF4186 domain-containing protein [Komagataeibacter swingsii]|uniref:DUF4186 domain-containing protein n=1 Tax=Komagataeibacter swingsii TaxID=215220 RepID=A0A2V4SDH2_9PROT|nr:DUF4186 domain-containing protein [Komagataeibacter swingsii]PYD69988.1 hypothetical protein CFR76_06755 [Komagataeibacter swingsii]GBQ56753.1 hypothetical protein AA16373_0816 [Komagataeibacter swingsii DSM 16373]